MSGSTFLVSLTLSAWFIVAALAGRDGWLVDLPRPLLPCIAVALMSIALLAIYAIAPVRRLFHALPLRLLIGLHLARLLGLAFFVTYSRMQMPGALALPAGIAESLVAIAAFSIAVIPIRQDRWRRIARWWNAIGFASVAGLLIGGFVLALLEPARAMAFARPPLSLQLLFLTPLAIVVHVILLGRLGQPAGPVDASPRRE